MNKKHIYVICIQCSIQSWVPEIKNEKKGQMKRNTCKEKGTQVQGCWNTEAWLGPIII